MTKTICNKSVTEECPNRYCSHATPNESSMLGICGTCPESSEVRVEIIEYLSDGNPNLAFKLRKT